MKRAPIVLVLAVALMLPTAAIAESLEGSPPEATADGAYALVDVDGNRISDGLDALLESAEPSERFDVIATFEDEMAAGKSAQSLPEQALYRRYALISGFFASLNKGQINALSHQPGIIRVDENFSVEATNNVTNDDFGTAAARIDYGVDGTDVGICIADTGYDATHEQLDDPGKLAGWFDAIAGLGTPYDDHWHGTHVAGTAAGAGTGGPDAATYRGVAPGATVYATKVLASNGGAVADSVEQGLEWCVAQSGVDIISMSLGTPTGSDGLDALSQAVNAAVAAGKIVIVAAGNSGDGPATVGAPGAAEHAITVGAVADWSGPVADPNHSNGVYLAPFSSRGPTRAPSSLTKPDIVGPGVTVTSAYPSGTSDYATATGTSMAAPFVAGAVALMLDANETLTSADVKALLEATAQDRGPAGKDNDWGWGLIDGYALVAEASGDPLHSPTVFPPNALITGSVESGGVWNHSFILGEDDLDTPIAATIILDGAPMCLWGFPDFCDLLGGWDWEPDLEAQLLDPTGAVLELSECPARGDCGSREPIPRATGHQETLHVMPTPETPGEYTIQVFPEQLPGASGGSFAVELSYGRVGPPAPSGSVVASGDNSFEVFVNGVLVGSSASWTQALRVSAELAVGDVVGVHALDAGGVAGFVGEVSWDGGSAVSDASWRVSTSSELASDWADQGYIEDGSWGAASSFGTYGVGPWLTNVSGFPSSSSAQWIWSSDNVNDDEVWLRYTIGTPPAPSGSVVASGDNSFEVFVNGVLVGSSASWTQALRVSAELAVGDVVGVHALDAGGVAGFVGEVSWDGGSAVSDASWRVSTSSELASDWADQGYIEDGSWGAASSFGTYGVGPWLTNVSGFPSSSSAEWIWSSDNVGDDEVWLRYVVGTPPAPSGSVVASGDNSFEVFVNGVLVGSSASWTQALRVSAELAVGDVVGVHALDAGGVAGFVGEVSWDGGSAVSDASWRVSTSSELASDWADQGYIEDGSWGAASSFGTYGVGPWLTNVSGFPSSSSAEWIWSSDNVGDDEVFLRYTLGT